MHVSIYLKGWRDVRRYADAVNDDTNPLHGEAMQAHACSFRPWQPGEHAYHAIDFDSEVLGVRDGDDIATLNRSFTLFNVGDDDTARRYRDAGHRSLSVGDLVVIDGRAYTCAEMGWKPVVFDPSTLPADPSAV